MMKTRLKTILLIFSATLILSLVLFAELAPTANAVDTAAKSITNTEAGSLGTLEKVVAAVNFDFTVIIDGGAGVNTVTKSPLPDYAAPLTVTLTAVPNAAWRFDHWDDNLADTASPKDLYVTGGEVITAHFVQRCFTLTRSHTGSGSDPVATPAKSTQCPTTGQYVAGEPISFSATPDLHWMISSWTGTDSGNTLVMPVPEGDHLVTANYTPICYSLGTSVVPTVAGTVNRSAGGPNCPAPGPASSYLEETVETLTAIPYDGYKFSNWSGAATGTDTETTVTMDNNYSVVANFEKGCHPLLLTHAPPGTGSDPQAVPSNSAGCTSGEYVFGESITLRNANPIPGWRVERWEGTNNDSSTSSSNSLTFPRLPASKGHFVTVYYIQKPTLDFSLASYNVNENAGSATIAVKRAGSLTEAVTVLVKSSNDTANAGQDYVAVNETLTFPPNSDEQTFLVEILDDGTSEGTESLKLTLSNQSVSAELGPQFEAELIILDDEGEPTVQFSTTTYEAAEASTSTTVTVTLFPPAKESVFVEFRTFAGSATSGEDYFDKAETLRFWPNQTSKLMSITLADDTLDEIDETVQLQLSDVSSGADLGASDATLTILDDDDPPTVQFSATTYFAKEGEATAPLTVTLSAASSLPVTVDYTVLETANGRQIIGNVIINPGEVSQAIIVPIAVNKADDRLSALLNSATNASLASPSNASLIILSKDRSECHILTLDNDGHGGPPIATNMPQSVGCPAGQYVANDLISLLAQPDSGWTINRWRGTLNDNGTLPENAVRMPDGNHAATAYYITSSFQPNMSFIYINYFDGTAEAEPNNALNTSDANGPIRFGQSYLGNFPTATDRWDIFFFSLAAKGNIQIDLTGIPGSRDYNLYLFANNKDQDLVGYSGSVDGLEEHISNSNLDPGVYFVAVPQCHGNASLCPVCSESEFRIAPNSSGSEMQASGGSLMTGSSDSSPRFISSFVARLAIFTIITALILVGCVRPAPDMSGDSGDTSTNPEDALPIQQEQVSQTNNVQSDTAVSTSSLPSPDSMLEADSGDFFIFHTVEEGDTLGTIAEQYETDTATLVTLNQIADSNIIFTEQILRVPGPAYELLVGPSFEIIPNGELVYGPSAAAFDVHTFAKTSDGYLLTHEEEVEQQSLTGPEIVQLVADRHSVNPKLLLAALEYQSGWITRKKPAEIEFALGYNNDDVSGLYRQLSWAANLLNWGYYGRSEGGMTSFVIGSEIPVTYASDAGLATGGVQHYLAARDNVSYESWLHDVGPDGFHETYNQLFGDVIDQSEPSFLPDDLTQPTFELPWASGETWYLTSGPHGGWNTGSAWAALDFVPPDTQAAVLPRRVG